MLGLSFRDGYAIRLLLRTASMISQYLTFYAIFSAYLPLAIYFLTWVSRR